MSQDFYYHPIPHKKYLTTGVNHRFEEQLEAAFGPLPITLTHEQLKPLRIMAKTLPEPGDLDELLQTIEVTGGVVLGRLSVYD